MGSDDSTQFHQRLDCDRVRVVGFDNFEMELCRESNFISRGRSASIDSFTKSIRIGRNVRPRALTQLSSFCDSFRDMNDKFIRVLRSNCLTHIACDVIKSFLNLIEPRNNE